MTPDPDTKRYTPDQWERLRHLMAACALKLDVEAMPKGQPKTTMLSEDDVLMRALPVESIDPVAFPRPTRVTGGRCPSCDSPDPRLHPAMQLGGEVEICHDDFHGEHRHMVDPWGHHISTDAAVIVGGINSGEL